MKDDKRANDVAEQNILGVHPTTRGMGWVLATSAVDLIDWGIARVSGDRNEMCLKKIREIVRSFAVDVIVMRNVSGYSKRRVKRIEKLITMVAEFAGDYGIEFKLFSKDEVSKTFERFGAKNREDIAEVLAKNIDALTSRLPPRRDLWKSEDARLGLFDAAAVMVAYFVERDLLENPFTTPADG